ncbi:MAG: dephospho-CoA kinase [Nocardioidaceae bacterium]
MLRVGLTGGIGSGKSEVSRRLRDRGAIVIDADVLAREAVAPGSDGLAALVHEFGDHILAEDGSLDRPALASRVFGDGAARRRLEAITHPRVRARATELEAAAPQDSIVVHDIPLLVETGQQDAFDVVLVVDVPPQVQADRLVGNREMSGAEAWARIGAQASREERTGAADLVVDNTGSLAGLDAAVEELWQYLQERRAKGPA